MHLWLTVASYAGFLPASVTAAHRYVWLVLLKEICRARDVCESMQLSAARPQVLCHGGLNASRLSLHPVMSVTVLLTPHIKAVTSNSSGAAANHAFAWGGLLCSLGMFFVLYPTTGRTVVFPTPTRVFLARVSHWCCTANTWCTVLARRLCAAAVVSTCPGGAQYSRSDTC
jgi:hypothetical protein